MMKTMKPWLLGSAAFLSMAASPALMAEPLFTANLGVTSNYIWRGVTASNDDAAVSGGVDFIHPSKAYAGVWSSSIGGGEYELDIYGGYSGKATGFNYDAGLIFYTYPGGDTNKDFTEVYLNMDFDYLTAQVALTLDKKDTSQDNDLYLSVATERELKKGLDLILTLGMYEFDDAAAEDYFHVRAALKKGEYTFALDANDKDRPANADDLRFTASWTHAFDL